MNSNLKLNINKYLKNEITIEELINYFDKNNYSKDEIKNNGIVYTPKYICEYIIEKINPKLNETVFEPSIGHGIFVFSLLEYIEKTYNLTNIELKEYFIKNVFGQDLKEKNIKELKEIIIAFFKKRNLEIELKEIDNFYIGNTLFSINTKIYDIIIGNPPYIRSKNLNDNFKKQIQKEYISCSSGNVDIYYAFIEFAYKNSKKCAFITPNSWLYNNSASILRGLVKNDLIEIIDFKEKRIFKNAATYVSIFIIDKGNQNSIISYKENISNDNKEIIEIKKEHLDDQRWIFNNDNLKSLKFKTLEIKTPIATLRDKIFITKEINTINMIPFYKISKIKSKEDFFKQKQKIIFPYKLGDNNKFNIKQEHELDKETLAYLNKNKEELNKRDKGKVEKYENWFAYGRKQGLNTYNENKSIIIVPGMISKNFIFFSIELKEIEQPFLFSSGFLLEIEKSEKEKLLNFLNSQNFKNYLIKEGKIWKGKDENSSYYSLNVNQLKKILK